LVSFVLFVMWWWWLSQPKEGIEANLMGVRGGTERIFSVMVPETAVLSETETFDEWWYRARLRIEMAGHSVTLLAALRYTMAGDCVEDVATLLVVMKVGQILMRVGSASSGLQIMRDVKVYPHDIVCPLMIAVTFANKSHEQICQPRFESEFIELWNNVRWVLILCAAGIGFTQGLRNTGNKLKFWIKITFFIQPIALFMSGYLYNYSSPDHVAPWNDREFGSSFFIQMIGFYGMVCLGSLLPQHKKVVQCYHMARLGCVAGVEHDIQPPNKSDNEFVCVVCLDGVNSYLVVPCGHQCLCVDCAPLFEEPGSLCPICRSECKIVCRVYRD